MSKPDAETGAAGVPRHIAIIMDGNGRWAKRRFLPKILGHRAGAGILRKLALEAEDLGVEYMTLYAFSTENWGRESAEVSALMALLGEQIQQYIDDADRHNMRLAAIGRRDRLPAGLVNGLNELERLTGSHTGLRVYMALDYGGRDEIARAVKKLCKDVLNGSVSVEDIDEPRLSEQYISARLDAPDVPYPDLLIRTGGEKRLSNFLIWQLAYSEFYYTDKLWPDFTPEDLRAAVLEYKDRERRFGIRS